MADIQLGGNFMLGPTGALVNQSNFITGMKIRTNRESITKPATLGKPVRSSAAGAPEYQLEISFFSGVEPASMWAQLWDAVESATGELDFTANLEVGVTSAANPKWSGRIVVMQLETGADVGSLRAQTQTYPVTQAGVVKVIV